jgi:hypothetical protein
MEQFERRQQQIEKLQDDANMKAAVLQAATLILPETLLLNGFNAKQFIEIKELLTKSILAEESTDLYHLQAVAVQAINNALENLHVEKHSLAAREFSDKLKQEMSIH